MSVISRLVDSFVLRNEFADNQGRITLDPHGPLAVPLAVEWRPGRMTLSYAIGMESRTFASQKKRANEAMDALTPQELGAIDALLALMPGAPASWSVSVSPAGVAVVMPLGEHDSNAVAAA